MSCRIKWITVRKAETELQSRRCCSRKKKHLCVSITEQQRDICPDEILNIILCNLFTTQAKCCSESVSTAAVMGGGQTDREDDGMGGDVSGFCFHST